MGAITLSEMRMFLGKSLSSTNANKINGLRAEIDFRAHLNALGFSQRVSPGGWLFRNVRQSFGSKTIAFFPHVIQPDVDYTQPPSLQEIPTHLHTICATFHQIGIASYYCHPTIANSEVKWSFIQLGVPQTTVYTELAQIAEGFVARTRRHGFLRYSSDTTGISNTHIPEEFSKENLRVFIQNAFYGELVDIDGIVWGEQFTYPIEIKEKTAGTDTAVGDFFGLDVGPFVKLAFYAAKRNNLHSIFVVREIDNPKDRNLIRWHYIKFDKLAQYASWNPIGGGTSMMGSRSTVIRIPKAQFDELNQAALRTL